MYLSFYRLKVKPFQNSTNPSFFWLGDMHKEALAIFKYGILKMPGILVLTGDVGTGKTTLINVLINDLGDNFIVVKVPDPDLEEIDFVNYLSDKLDFKKKFTSKDMFYRDFREFLGGSSLAGKKVLLVIDECQRLCSPLLEAITALATLEKNTRKSLTVLLIGQNEFNEVVKKNNHSALNQLISINYAIEPLNLSETGEFIKHRLKVAGAKKEIFTPDAITKIYQFSAGIPRRINIICDHVLLIGFAKETETVNAALVKSCVEDLRPQALSNGANSDPLNSFVANEDFRYLRTIPTEPREKIPINRVWKIFGIIFLVTIPAFLTIFFTDQMTFRDLVYYFKTGGMQNLHTENKEVMRRLNSPLQPDQKHASIEQKAPQDTGMLQKNRITEKKSAELSVNEDLTNENNPSTSGLLNDKKAVVTRQTAIKSSRKDDLPAIVPIGTDTIDGNQTNMQIVLPLLPGQQGAANEKNLESGGILSGTAGKTNSTNKPDLTGAADIENETTFENDTAHADIISPATEITSLNDAPDIRVSGEIKAEIKDSLTKENELKMNSSVVLSKDTEKPKNLPDRTATPEKLPAASEALDDGQGKVDPGAVIDWILEKRSR